MADFCIRSLIVDLYPCINRTSVDSPNELCAGTLDLMDDLSHYRRLVSAGRCEVCLAISVGDAV